VADVPVGALLSGGIDSTMVATLMARSSGAPIKTLRRMLVDHRSGRQDNSRVLFNLLTFELWHERFISGPAGSDAGHGVDRLAVAEAVS